MVTKNEEASDYACMFSNIKRLSEQILNKTYEPTILLADCAEAITNGNYLLNYKNSITLLIIYIIKKIGFKQVFTLKKRIFCWAHVIRAIDKKLAIIKDKPIRASIRLDIVNFHKNVSEENFVTVMRLMITKWREIKNDEVNTFIKYCMPQWSSPKRIVWFDRYCNFVPSHTNALESTNRYVK